jgi:hypothetical protein
MRNALSTPALSACRSDQSLSLSLPDRQRGCVQACFMEKESGGERQEGRGRDRNWEGEVETETGKEKQGGRERELFVFKRNDGCLGIF